MKVYISVDMEGVAGVVVYEQCNPGTKEYDRFRKLMTLEANAAIEGAIEAGATEVCVNDGHGPMTNLIIEDLHPEAELISGVTKLLLQVEGIDDGFDALFYVGYHQREGGGDGVLNHTLLGRVVYEVRINGEPVDEAGINAPVAGAYGVPVALVTGDDQLCAEAQRRFPGVIVAPVKHAIDRFSARSLTPSKARSLIRERASQAVEAARAGRLRPSAVTVPVTIEIDFKRTAPAHMCTLIPGVERTGPRTIAIEHGDYVTAYKVFLACSFLGLHTAEGQL